MINSMQYIMVSTNPTSPSHQHKKIAWDLSFLYIEWKFKELRDQLSRAQHVARLKIAQDIKKSKALDIKMEDEEEAYSGTQVKIEDQNVEDIVPTQEQIMEAKQYIMDTISHGEDKQHSDIFVNFFIKLAVYSCQEKEEKEIVQRSLYLLKKTLFIWPNTKIKFE